MNLNKLLKFNGTIASFDFKENTIERCIYLKISERKFIFFILYVDNKLLANSNLTYWMKLRNFSPRILK